MNSLTVQDLPKTIKKRNGNVVSFDSNKINIAIKKSFEASDEEVNESQIENLTNEVCKGLSGQIDLSVEQCQDFVQLILINNGFYNIAKKYMNYRYSHHLIRKTNMITDEMKTKFYESVRNSMKSFSTPYSYIVYLRTYARWLGDDYPNDPSKQRRESWEETVDRFVSFMTKKVNDKIENETIEEIRSAIFNMDIMPSMRMLQFAGKPVEINNLCAYNCCYVAPTCIDDITDIMYILMCGTGVGFSVESKFVNQFPIVKEKPDFDLPEVRPTITTSECRDLDSSRIPITEYPSKIFVSDSKEGWVRAFRYALHAWYNGIDITFNFSKIRNAGVRLRTTGGIASGPEPLKQLFSFTKNIIRGAVGRKLKPIELHKILCMTGNIVVQGGVRRSAMISLSDLHDEEMANCKGKNWDQTKDFCLYGANNSAVYEKEPTNTELLNEWTYLVNSRSGERGIFNRSSLYHTLPKRRLELIEHLIPEMGTNPCGEIILLSHQLCNLTSVICKPEDTEESLLNKIRLATIVGTFQSSLTDFTFVSRKFKERAELERLLGVSLAGQCDCPILRNSDNSEHKYGNSNLYAKLRDYSIIVNEKYAQKLGINSSTCITAVKPDGNLGATVGCSSGLKPSHSKFFIRRIRCSRNDALSKTLIDEGVPYEPEVGQTHENATTYVFSFPCKSKENTLLTSDINALDMLDLWKVAKINYTEHNPSVTVNVTENEWIDCLYWIKNNWKYVGGLTFFPYENHNFKLAPYEEINEDEYNSFLSTFPKEINFGKMIYYEKSSEINQKAVPACSGEMCERNS